MPSASGKRVDDDKQRDKSSSSDNLVGIGLAAGQEKEETGLGPLVDSARVTGGQAFERWSSSLKEVAARHSEDRARGARTRRDQYLGFLDNPQYGGASYPINNEWGKYQREWGGSGAVPRQDPGARNVVSGTGGSPLTGPLQPIMPSSGTPSRIPNTLNAPQGNLPGVGSLPSYMPDRRQAPSSPRPDYSVPKQPGRGFDF